MAEDIELPDFPEYVSVKGASKILEVTEARVYGYVEKERLPSTRVGGAIIILRKDAEDFKRRLNPPGRRRKKSPDWRKYNARSNVFTTGIQVRVREGQQQKFIDRLQAIRRNKLHTLKGSIARFVQKDQIDPDLIRIWLVWKDIEMPDLEAHEREMDEFQDELADVLDWETARYEDGEGLIYT